MARHWYERGFTAFITAGIMLVAAACSPTFATSTAQETGRWRVTCGGASGEACQLMQAASLRLGEPPLLLMTVAKNLGTGKRFGVITTPLKVYLAPGIRIAVDGKRPFKALFELCDEAGCHAGFPFEGAVLDAFRKGMKAEITVWTAKDRAVIFPVALGGFSKAYEQLDKGRQP